MEVSSVTNSTVASSDLSAVANQTLDKTAFLKLLITQLRYQDPMSPMDDTQFVSQLAQFSSLEQMQELNSGFITYASSALASEAFALIGKTVEYADADLGTQVKGVVDKVTFQDGVPKLDIGSTTIDLTDVVAVY
jgi:flagellar basal-body rod modification protein FlgD